MLSLLNRRFRYKAAALTAVLYAFCVLIPHAALAFGGPLGHCLAEISGAHVHQPRAVVHVHADGTRHTHPRQAGHSRDTANHDQQGTDHGAPANCCGLFCLSAVAEEPPPGLALVHVGTTVVADNPQYLSGCAAARINRPPIA